MLSPKTAIKICQLHVSLCCCLEEPCTLQQGRTAKNHLHAQALSADGRCKTFDDTADGYGRGEAFVVACVARCGTCSNPLAILQVCVCLMQNALHAGRCLGLQYGSSNLFCCTPQGSAINQDGRSSSLTAPNGPSQTGLILAALHAADASAAAVAGMAVHGTGTPLGDPIGEHALHLEPWDW